MNESKSNGSRGQLLRPNVFFAKVALNPSLKRALLFQFFVALFTTVLAQLRAGASTGEMAVLYSQNLHVPLLAGQAAIFVFFFLFVLVGFLIENSIFSLAVLIICRLAKNNVRYKTLYSVFAYTDVAKPLAELPLAGNISAYVVWAISFLLCVVALKQAARSSYRFAVPAQIALFAIIVGASTMFIQYEHGKAERMSQLQGQAQALLHNPAPAITIHPIDGPPVDLASLKGQVVVLDFWATWCPPCRRALPVVSQVAMSRKDKGVAFYAISNESKSDITSYLSSQHLQVNPAIDVSNEALTAFAVSGIPHTVVIDKAGIIHAFHVGYAPEEKEELEKEIDECLAAPAAAQTGK